MILAVAALATAGVLAAVPVSFAGTAGPIAVGAGIAAVALVAWSLSSGATPPLLMAVLLILFEYGGVLVLADGRLWLAPVAATGLYLVVELSMRSLELRGRHPGWRAFGSRDAAAVVVGALAVGGVSWLVAAVGTGFEVPGGIFIQAVGVAAIAAVIGIIWTLARE